MRKRSKNSLVEEPETVDIADVYGEIDIEETIYQGHQGLVKMDVLNSLRIFMLGAGSIGSFGAIAMAKMGIKFCHIVDFDSIELHNQANQIYNWHQTGRLKNDMLKEYLKQYRQDDWNWSFFNHKLEPTDSIPECDVIVCAVDNMAARKMLFNLAKKDMKIKLFIDARIGATSAECYAIQPFMPDEVEKFEKQHLDDDSKIAPLKCTEKSIIFPVMFTSSWITAALFHLANGDIEKFPYGLDVNFKTMEFFKDKR